MSDRPVIISRLHHRSQYLAVEQQLKSAALPRLQHLPQHGSRQVTSNPAAVQPDRPHDSAQRLKFFGVRFLVDAVDKRNPQFFPQPGSRFTCQQHKFLDHPFGPAALTGPNAAASAVLTDDQRDLTRFELRDAAGGADTGAQAGEPVHHQQLLTDIRIFLFDQLVGISS